MAYKITYDDILKMEAQFQSDVKNKEPRCPRCGKKLIKEDKASSYTIHCEDKECLSFTSRGI